jgi:hypothetical protein
VPRGVVLSVLSCSAEELCDDTTGAGKTLIRDSLSRQQIIFIFGNLLRHELDTDTILSALISTKKLCLFIG